MATSTKEVTTKQRPRMHLSQSDVPAYSLKEALRVPESLRDQYGKQPTRPLMVAAAMKMTPTSGPFRMVTGAAVAYGLTEGAAQSTLISLTALGRRIVSPTSEGDDIVAMREAALKPRVISEFLQRYDGNRLPSREIALNVLEEMGVPAAARDRAHGMIMENALLANFVEEISGHQYVNLDNANKTVLGQTLKEDTTQIPEAAQLLPTDDAIYNSGAIDQNEPSGVNNNLANNKRVFITHGSNKAIVEQLKEVLTFGGFDPIVSIENEAIAKPVPDKVMDEMRSCGAGIVHVGADQTLLDKEGNEHKVLNSNVLIEIGAALALYKRNFILLVEDGVLLPSNLRGLYEVRYNGTKLDYESTMKLLKAFNEFRTMS